MSEVGGEEAGAQSPGSPPPPPPNDEGEASPEPVSASPPPEPLREGQKHVDREQSEPASPPPPPPPNENEASSPPPRTPQPPTVRSGTPKSTLVPGARKMLFVACDSANTLEEVPGTMQATVELQEGLKNEGFIAQSLTLTDAGPWLPTRENIIAGLWWVTEDLLPGDSILISFVGASIRLPSQGSGIRSEANYCCLDYRTCGPITHLDIQNSLSRVPSDVFITLICDFDQGGSLLTLSPTSSITHPETVSEGAVSIEVPISYNTLHINCIHINKSDQLPSELSSDLTTRDVESYNIISRGLGKLISGTKEGDVVTFVELAKYLAKGVASDPHKQISISSTQQPSPNTIFSFSFDSSTHALYRRRSDLRVPLTSVLQQAQLQSTQLAENYATQAQRSGHIEMKKLLEEEMSKIEGEMKNLHEAIESRKSQPEPTSEAAIKLEEIQKSAQQREESWLNLMKSLVVQSSSEDQARIHQADDRSLHLEARRKQIEAEEQKLENERLVLLARTKTDHEALQQRWEALMKTVEVQKNEVANVEALQQTVEEVSEYDRLQQENFALKLGLSEAKIQTHRYEESPLPPEVVRAVQNAGAEKHLQAFHDAEINCQSFSLMNSRDFLKLGITELGVRLKLANEASKMKFDLQKTPFCDPIY